MAFKVAIFLLAVLAVGMAATSVLVGPEIGIEREAKQFMGYPGMGYGGMGYRGMGYGGMGYGGMGYGGMGYGGMGMGYGGYRRWGYSSGWRRGWGGGFYGR